MFSQIEKGNMNIFLKRDFKCTAERAPNKTKKKIQLFFLRKDYHETKDKEKADALEQELKLSKNLYTSKL